MFFRNSEKWINDRGLAHTYLIVPSVAIGNDPVFFTSRFNTPPNLKEYNLSKGSKNECDYQISIKHKKRLNAPPPPSDQPSNMGWYLILRRVGVINS